MKKVLLVDDDRFTHDLIKEHLSSYDLDIKSAFTPLEAFEDLKTGTYDVAFVDFSMSPMTGDQLFESTAHLNIRTKMYFLSGYDRDFLKYKIKNLSKSPEGVISKDNMKVRFKEIFGND